MEAWLAWARGPMFWFALIFFVLGLIRHIALTIWEVKMAVSRAGDKNVPWAVVLKATREWLLPFGKLGNRLCYGVTTLVFHVSILIVPIFLAGHIALIQRGTGLAWPSLPQRVADVLSVVAVLSAGALVLHRLLNRQARGLSLFSDYLMPVLVALPFLTGLMLAMPALTPFGHETTFFLHVMTANLVLILTPITKLSHCVLMPSGQIVSEVGWRFPADAGRKMAIALHKENEPI